MRCVPVLILSLVFGIPGFLIDAGEAAGDGREGVKKAEVEKADGRTADAGGKGNAGDGEKDEGDKDEGNDHEARLGRTVLLRFKMIPEDDPGQRLSVLCAAEGYSLRASFATAEGTMQFKVSGRVQPVPDEDGKEDVSKLFVTFDVNLEMAGPQGKFAVGGEGSAVAKVGGETILAELGEKMLCVEVGEPIRNPREGKPAPPPKADEPKF